MKKVCRLLFFALLPILAEAQYDRILNNPDVIWAAEIDVTYYLRPPLPSDSVQQNDIIFWKNFDPNNRVPYEGSEMLMEKILAAARSGEWSAWQFAGESVSVDHLLIPLLDLKGPSLQIADKDRQISIDEVPRILDSYGITVVLNPDTGEDELKETPNTWDITTWYAIRAKQLLYFDENKGDFELLTFAIAPVRLFKRYEYDRKIGENRVYLSDFIPFWLKMPDFSKKKSRRQPNVNDSHISWAAQIKTLGNSPRLENLRLLKDFKPPVMQVLLDRFRTDAKYKVYDTTSEPIPFEARHDMLLSIDTLIMINAETYEEKIEVEKNELRAEDFPHLRLIQNWYWDDRQRRLVIHLQSFAPLLSIIRPYLRQIHYERPLFYRRKK